MLISIHSPLTGRDGMSQRNRLVEVLISIHPPLTGRDSSPTALRISLIHFNPLSPHGERRDLGRQVFISIRISIHSPLTGRDIDDFVSKQLYRIFQSTLPSRGETHQETLHRVKKIYFNPLSPHGERLNNEGYQFKVGLFQSTLPSRGETRRAKT